MKKFDPAVFDDADKFDTLINALTHEFANEGGDIGDAADFDELMGNNCNPFTPHDNFTIPEFLNAIAQHSKTDPKSVAKYAAKYIADMCNEFAK